MASYFNFISRPCSWAKLECVIYILNFGRDRGPLIYRLCILFNVFVNMYEFDITYYLDIFESLLLLIFKKKIIFMRTNINDSVVNIEITRF